jgi:hypothetical protein
MPENRSQTSPGAHGYARAPGSKSADSAQPEPMQNNAPRGLEPSQNDRDEPKNESITLFGRDCSSEQDGELIVVYSPHAGADAGCIHATPDDFEDLRLNR